MGKNAKDDAAMSMQVVAKVNQLSTLGHFVTRILKWRFSEET